MDPTPPPIQRFSSRRGRLDRSFLTARLQGARAYDRIAGYFSSSMLEIAGEALDSVEGKVRVVCNSGLNPRDVETARAAQSALRQEWCASKPEGLVEAGGDAARSRFARLFHYLTTGRLEVRVLPDAKFGLIHGKAGVVTLADGQKTSFLGSVNETLSGWRINYELLWEDPSPEAVAWVQEEFDALWGSPSALPLADFIVEDVGRIAARRVIATVEEWRKPTDSVPTDPAPALIETPVYREQVGLWEHQKYFVKLAFDAHTGPYKQARFVLADQVGLGKTIQLAMVAQLIALVGSRPILILAPKTLLWQWQDEMRDLLDMPSAVWNGRQWVDEQGIEYPAVGAEGIRKCPRRVGVVSTGLISRRSAAGELLKAPYYDCVIVDEAHHARRSNLQPGCENEGPEPNNLLAFLIAISPRTRSMLLATATPVQMNPVEAWDLLNVLAGENDNVLGNRFSKWRDSAWALDLVTAKKPIPGDLADVWEWVRNPLPPKAEHTDFLNIRRTLDLDDTKAVANGIEFDRLRPPDRARLKNLAQRFFREHNPFIRHIVRRTRKYLEELRDESGEPYLKPIEVRLHGEGDAEAIPLPPYLEEAYQTAEAFTKLVAARVKSAGFLKTMLLRRLGSSIEAGKVTAEKLLGVWETEDDAEDDDSGDEPEPVKTSEFSKGLTDQERGVLKRLVDALEANQERDPKYAVVRDCLIGRHWLDRGCIIFSQYYDSIRWLAEAIAAELPATRIGIYAGASRSGLYRDGRFERATRDQLKAMVRSGDLRLLLGTEAASEGLNLQALGTLINLDLPWNPTRLEQRKGRIQRIGQVHDSIDIYNMRYKGSVEDRVHHLLSARFKEIFNLFGQIPDTLEDVWVEVAIGAKERAKDLIEAVPKLHPFEIRYQHVEKVNWESCARVLDRRAKQDCLRQGWG